jgi:hypothetical protein
MAVIHDSQGRGIDQNNPLNVTIAGSTATGGSLGVTTSDILPIDIQSHLTSTIMTHNAVSVASVGNSLSSYYDADGFTDIAIHYKGSVGVTSIVVDVFWSTDGVNFCGVDYNVVLTDSSNTTKSAITSLKARYFMVKITNTSATAVTATAYAFLKA